MRHAFPFIKELLGITRVLIHCVWPSGINQPQWIKAAGDSFWLQFKKKKKNVNWPSHSEMKLLLEGEFQVTGESKQHWVRLWQKWSLQASTK